MWNNCPYFILLCIYQVCNKSVISLVHIANYLFMSPDRSNLLKSFKFTLYLLYALYDSSESPALKDQKSMTHLPVLKLYTGFIRGGGGEGGGGGGEEEEDLGYPPQSYFYPPPNITNFHSITITTQYNRSRKNQLKISYYLNFLFNLGLLTLILIQTLTMLCAHPPPPPFQKS